MRSPRLVSSAILAALATLAVATPALAVTVSPDDDPLPGSTFEGGDGNQIASGAGRTDWAELQAQDRVLHMPDPNATDDAFSGGKKDGIPGEWEFRTANNGVSPGGTNVLDGHVSVDQANGSIFLYLASTRESDTGTSYISFELNRDARLWNNGRALIPCRRTGDIMITYLPQGSSQQVIAQRWVTTTADTATGCARVGTLQSLGLHAPAAPVDVQGAFNATTFTNSLLGQATTIAPRLFGETALNLTSLLSTLGDSCRAFGSFWIYSHSSDADTSNMSDIVWPRPLDVRTCSASGTKFEDTNANGVRDPGEPGLEGFRIFADYDDDGVLDDDEPYAYTDAQGNYVVDGIEDSSYTLRETTPTGTNAAGWRCSFPNASVTAPGGATTTAPGGLFPCGWHVDRDTEPYAQGRDFGNWRPAHLTLEKRVAPANDTTVFTLQHPGRGEPFQVTGGDSVGGDLGLTPGTYTAGEVAAPDFVTHVVCEQDDDIVLDTTTVSATLTLGSGDHVVCRFYNSRIGVPAIELVKSAPERVTAGETIHYTLHVTNIGTVGIPVTDIDVNDPGCSGLHQVGEAPDETLNPGETLTFACTRETSPPGDDCVSHTVANTATATVGDDDRDQDSETVDVICPHPAIALSKVGQETAPAGSVVRFAFYVFNIGDTSFHAGGALRRTAGVSVADAKCDADPVIADKFDAEHADDPTPETFDPGDVWVFTCLATTPSRAPDGTCKDFVSTNTAVAQANTDPLGATARDAFDTTLTCTPPGPPEPPAPPPPAPEPVLPLPDLPIPPSPDGPSLLGVGDSGTAPSAGVSGAGSIRIASPRRCLRRGSVVVLGVQRAASVALTIAGRPVQGLDVRPLQSRVVIRVRRGVPPGRHRVDAVIRFQRGAATEPLRLSRVVRGCAAARRAPAPSPPPVTG